MPAQLHCGKLENAPVVVQMVNLTGSSLTSEIHLQAHL